MVQFTSTLHPHNVLVIKTLYEKYSHKLNIMSNGTVYQLIINKVTRKSHFLTILNELNELVYYIFQII